MQIRAFRLLVSLLCIASFASCNPEIVKAANEEDFAKVEALLEAGGDPNEANKYGWTALMFASYRGSEKIVNILLGAGADPNLVSEKIVGNTMAPVYPTTALKESLREGHVNIARILIAKGAEIDNETYAITGGTGDIELLKLMIAKGIDPIKADQEEPALLYAVNNGRVDTVIWLLENGTDPDVCKGNPLMAAVWSGNLEIAKILLDKGADPNGPVPGQSSYLHAIYRHTVNPDADPEFKLLKLLLKYGANPNSTEDDYPMYGRTPIDYLKTKRDEASARLRDPIAAAKDHDRKVIQHLDKLIPFLEKL